MKILDEVTSKSLNNITILLKKNECIQLIGYIEELLLDNLENEHFHLNNENYSKEITVALYGEDVSLNNFSERYKELILTDE